MVIENNRSTIAAINNLVVDNNPISIIACLRNNGVSIADTSRGNLFATLQNLFDTNKPLWVATIRCFKYDSSVNNYTTDPTLRANLIETIAFQNKVSVAEIQNSRFDIGNIFDTIGDFIGGGTTTGGGIKEIATKPAINPIAAIAITIVGIIIVAIIAFKK